MLDDMLGRSPRSPQSPATQENPKPEDGVRPLLRARDLQLEGGRGPVFGPLDTQLYAGQRAVVVGQQGTGRSALLLALGGRMKGVTGELRVDGIDGIAHPRKLRQLTSIARISGLAELEPSLTVGECRDERSLTEAIGVRRGKQRFTELQNALGEWFDPEEVVEHLPAFRRTLLTAMLGCLRPAAYVLLDDIDASLTDDQQLWIHRQLDVLTEAGNTFIVSALDTAKAPPGAIILRLDPHPHTEEA
ncbi:hypothetical protein BI335_13820 [Enemella evansiae]|uniref:ATP-binding cassette domain-containing protein n=1 Tax=Enemella evansiae TaxID=2016499 RepID=UPI000B96673F|nr:ATP-binding cassette domain-containing protein [Enemella evansiae]OYO13165.1 hypothetical protein BI335_13820 [Enemella evansiae]